MEINSGICTSSGTYRSRTMTSPFKIAVPTGNKAARGKGTKAAKALAEAIILQSIEDLWREKEKSKRLEFFTGDGFNICSKIAGLGFLDQIAVLNLVKSASVKIQRMQQGSRARRLKKENRLEEVMA